VKLPEKRKSKQEKHEFILLGDEDERRTQWLMLKNYRILPKAGGLDDQEPEYVADMATLDSMYAEEYNKIAEEQRHKPR
jgi:hypothetical protein